MNREIKFRAFEKNTRQMYWFDIMWGNHNSGNGYIGMVPWGESQEANGRYRGNMTLVDPEECEIMRFTELLDKNGKEIYEGDIIRLRSTYRSTQTHAGNNIPNGSYTEPMEPAIRTEENEVIWREGSFCFGEEHVYGSPCPLSFVIREWSEEDIKESIGFRRSTDLWDDPEEGELQYLLEEYPPNTLEELIEYLRGVEIIGNIHENPELL